MKNEQIVKIYDAFGADFKYMQWFAALKKKHRNRNNKLCRISLLSQYYVIQSILNIYIRNKDKFTAWKMLPFAKLDRSTFCGNFRANNNVMLAIVRRFMRFLDSWSEFEMNYYYCLMVNAHLRYQVFFAHIISSLVLRTVTFCQLNVYLFLIHLFVRTI